MNRNKTILLIVVAIILLLGSFFLGRSSKRCPEAVTLVEVIKDTVEMNMYRETASKYRSEADSLRSIPPQIKIKYEKIYLRLESADDRTIDSLYRAALRHD